MFTIKNKSNCLINHSNLIDIGRFQLILNNNTNYSNEDLRNI